MTAIEDRDRQHVQNGEVDVENDAEPKSELPAILTLEQHVIDAHDHNRAAHMLELHVRAGRRHRANRLQGARDTVIDLLHRVRMRE